MKEYEKNEIVAGPRIVLHIVWVQNGTMNTT